MSLDALRPFLSRMMASKSPTARSEMTPAQRQPRNLGVRVLSPPSKRQPSRSPREHPVLDYHT